MRKSTSSAASALGHLLPTWYMTGTAGVDGALVAGETTRHGWTTTAADKEGTTLQCLVRCRAPLPDPRAAVARYQLGRARTGG